ncbi:MAG: type I-B CRISPR-associated protein Cas5b [Candidatus Aenigmarchaeota archaeon]|nr:type I-B CRISPR-associated protein Cas5b [Candidatus Aenigmarchaeota archaeon]MDW8149137.1 type I-B CRISPR-associated protein Cas5b [Candidatus Aenigmarchaeota archaeon]
MKVIVFDVFGDYGHFRKIWTTSSPETYSFPSHSTVAGMIGSIIGLGSGRIDSQEEYLSVLSYEKCSIAVRLMNPVKKFRTTISLINTKFSTITFKNGNIQKTIKVVDWLSSDMVYTPVKIVTPTRSHEPYTLVNIQLLKNPHYRIYFTHKDERVFQRIYDCLKDKKIHYNLCLGLSEYLADYQFIGVFDAKMVKYDGLVDVQTVIPKRKILEFRPNTEGARKYVKEDIFPIHMNTRREVILYDEIIYEAQGKSIQCKCKELVELSNGERVVFY